VINTRIITYHFIKNPKNKILENVPGLNLSSFVDQIKYLKKNYSIISMEELIYNFSIKKKLNKSCVVLTFDDGYLDHFKNVFPILSKYKIKGAFYAPTYTLRQKGLLDINKIHLILSKFENKNQLKKEIEDFLIKKNIHNKVEKELQKTLKEKSKKDARKYDDKATISCKILLQYLIPEKEKKKIVNLLFKKYVSNTEEKFVKKLYLNSNQAKEMIKEGMHFGSHGVGHYWWEYLTKKGQEKEIIESKKYLNNLGMSQNNFTACYPYGSYNKSTLKILKKNDCKIGLITKQDVIRNFNINPLLLPRVDTNEIKNN
jgi:peptidoglycan/xylan/chitin deacetylase (PgdA/CDA1 family)